MTWPARTGHGTYARYQQHKRSGDHPCDLCRLANNAYTTLYRWTHDGWRGLQRDHQRRRAVAVAELIRRHPVEFGQILHGVPVTEVTRAGYHHFDPSLLQDAVVAGDDS